MRNIYINSICSIAASVVLTCSPAANAAIVELNVGSVNSISRMSSSPSTTTFVCQCRRGGVNNNFEGTVSGTNEQQIRSQCNKIRERRCKQAKSTQCRIVVQGETTETEPSQGCGGTKGIN